MGWKTLGMLIGAGAVLAINGQVHIPAEVTHAVLQWKTVAEDAGTAMDGVAGVVAQMHQASPANQAGDPGGAPGAVTEDANSKGADLEEVDTSMVATTDAGGPTPFEAENEPGVEQLERQSGDQANTIATGHTVAQESWVAVWVPFVVEASARGFSRHVETQTGYPARVISREDRYVVEVGCAVGQDRETVVETVTAALGQRKPRVGM